MKPARIIKESSLGRLLSHISGNPKIKSWGIISAFRKSNSKRQNLELNKRLEADIRSLNLGIIKLEGHWKECQLEDVPYEKCPADKLVDTIEHSFFIPNISKEDLKKVTSKYNQDASVFSETPGEASLLFKNGSVSSLGKMSVGKIGQGFSKIKGRTFTFEQKISYFKSLLK
jgi:hypothetical protein